MTTWFSPKWRRGGTLYVACIAMLAASTLISGQEDAYFGLIVLSLPTGYVMLGPIYVAAAMADWVLGSGPSGSPASVVIGVVGFSFAATLNVLLLRVAASGISTCRRRHLRECVE